MHKLCSFLIFFAMLGVAITTDDETSVESYESESNEGNVDNNESLNIDLELCNGKSEDCMPPMIQQSLSERMGWRKHWPTTRPTTIITQKPTPTTPEITTDKNPSTKITLRPDPSTTTYVPINKSTMPVFKTTPRVPITKPTKPTIPVTRTTPHTGGIVFPDDDDDNESHTTKSPPSTTDVATDGAKEPVTPISSTTDPLQLTTPTPAQQYCMLNCPVTPEYNPVCGSNGAMYANPGRLQCAQNCGVNVVPISREECGLTTEAPITISTQSPIMRECIRQCPASSEYNPVCGSNGVTYKNAGTLLCDQACGIDVKLKRYGACPVTTTTTKRTVEPKKDCDIASTTSTPSLLCFLNCAITPEYSPVCGNDGRTYNNYGWLICAQRCGVDVQLDSRGACGESSTLSTVTPRTPVTTTQSIILQNCIARCPSTNEFNPVCGTNFVTYDNASKLRCARLCGVDVKIARPNPCIPGRRNRNKTTTPTPKPSI